MLVRSWLDALKPHFTRQPTRRQRRAAGLGGRSRHLHVEPLEDRRLMGFDPAVAYPTAAYPAGVVAADFAPGETKTITIEVKGDNKKEANETFYLDLFGNSSNSLFTKNRGVGTILNDD